MASQPNTNLFDELAQSGAEILTDSKSLEYYASDVYERGADLTAVVRPHGKDELAAAVAVATDNGLSIIPRGGGMSYTGAYTARKAGAVLIDTEAMDRVLDINEENRTVTVEPGCTWKKLFETLKPMGLRTPFWGTLSGIYATVGGGMSQNGIFWGTGRHGTAVQSCLSLEMVLADGTILNTGADFMRPYGPDLTGLFLADTGAMGVKASITLRLIPEAKANGYATFTFETHEAALGAMADIERAQIASECFGFDPHLNAIRMRRDSMTSDAKQLAQMMKKQGSVLKALKEGTKVVLGGRSFLKDANYSLHVLTEGRIQAAADADIEEARAIAKSHDGTEVENTIPKIVRANPFVPPNAMRGPDGERWAPIHGLLPHSKSIECYEAIMALFESNKDRMEVAGIHYGVLIAAVGGAGSVLEPCLYWPDASNAYVDSRIEDAHLAKLPKLEHDPDSWALVKEIKQAIVDLFYDHGAAHFQIGRTYRYLDSLDPRAKELLEAVKTNLDPQTRMNPGALGLGNG